MTFDLTHTFAIQTPQKYQRRPLGRRRQPTQFIFSALTPPPLIPWTSFCTHRASSVKPASRTSKHQDLFLYF